MEHGSARPPSPAELAHRPRWPLLFRALLTPTGREGSRPPPLKLASSTFDLFSFGEFVRPPHQGPDPMEFELPTMTYPEARPSPFVGVFFWVQDPGWSEELGQPTGG